MIECCMCSVLCRTLSAEKTSASALSCRCQRRLDSVLARPQLSSGHLVASRLCAGSSPVCCSYCLSVCLRLVVALSISRFQGHLQ